MTRKVQGKSDRRVVSQHYTASAMVGRLLSWPFGQRGSCSSKWRELLQYSCLPLIHQVDTRAHRGPPICREKTVLRLVSSAGSLRLDWPVASRLHSVFLPACWWSVPQSRPLDWWEFHSNRGKNWKITRTLCCNANGALISFN